MVPGGVLKFPFPVFGARIVPASTFSRGQRHVEGQEGEEAPNARLEARLVQAYHSSYATKKFGGAHTVDLPDEEFAQAEELTRKLTDDPRTHAIVRPAFFWKEAATAANTEDVGIGVRAGALVRRSDKTHFCLTVFRATRSVYEKSSRTVDASGNVRWSTRWDERKIDPDYLLELGLKFFVAKWSGVPVNQAGIVHLNGERVFEGDSDPAGFLKFIDLTKIVSGMEEEVREEIRNRQRRHESLLLLPDEAWESPPLPPPTDISRLYVLTDPLRAAFDRLNIKDIRDIPDDLETQCGVALSDIQRRQVSALRHGEMVVEEKATLKAALQDLLDRSRGGRLSFLDFETIAPPVALVKGSQNGETIVLQYSNDWIGADGKLVHNEILYDEDPLREGALERWDKTLAESILESVGPAGPIVVFNAVFEKTAIRQLVRRLRDRGGDGEEALARRLEGLLVDGPLKDLAGRLEDRGLTIFAEQLRKVIGSEGMTKKYMEHLRKPRGRGKNKKEPAPEGLRLADDIEGILKADRIIDLLPLVRNHVYHPGFDGSFGLKSVLKCLCEGRGYDDLQEVHDGGVATQALEEMIDGSTTEDRRREIRQRLLAYCGRDTIAEVWVLKELFGAAELDWPFQIS